MNNTHFVIRDLCPACGSKDLSAIYQGPLDEDPIKDYLKTFYSLKSGDEFDCLKGAVYFLYECKVCDLIFQREIPNDRLMKRIYEHWIGPQKAFTQHLEQDSLWLYTYHAQEIMQIIASFKQAPSALHFFDFGMGWGKWALMAKAFGCNSYGFELSEERVEYAKSNGVKAMSWDEIPQHQFDFINTEQVFEHIPAPLNTLCHLKKALKPDGLLKINVPTAKDIKRRLRIMDWKAPKGTRNSLNPVAPLEHINFFRRPTLIKMASATGMKEVFIPMKLQYKYMTNWGGIETTLENLLRPINRNILKGRNYILLRK